MVAVNSAKLANAGVTGRFAHGAVIGGDLGQQIRMIALRAGAYRDRPGRRRPDVRLAERRHGRARRPGA